MKPAEGEAQEEEEEEEEERARGSRERLRSKEDGEGEEKQGNEASSAKSCWPTFRPAEFTYLFIHGRTWMARGT